MKHKFTSPKAAAADPTLVDGPKWNQPHIIVGRPVAANTTLSVDDDLILATGGIAGISIAPPPNAPDGTVVMIMKVDSGAGVVTVLGTINGNPNFELEDQWQIVEIRAQGGTWQVLRGSSSISGAVLLRPIGGQTIVPVIDGLRIETIPVASLDPFTLSDHGPGSVFNSFVLNSSGVSTLNLRKALSVFYQGDLNQGDDREYYGIQANAFALLNAASGLSSRICALGGQFGWKGSAAAPAGLEAHGVLVQPRVTGTGCNGGQLISFISYNPQITEGATVDGVTGIYIDHAALDGTKVTGFNIGISVYVGAGGWNLDLAGGNGSAFGPQPIYHSTDALINGGTVTAGWFAGLGSPEGSVVANQGSFYSRLDGGAGTSFYVKESGTGNTGWVAK